MLIFCKSGLNDIQPPCIAQSFVAHNALLYKLYVVGDSHFLVSRPSLKNFIAEGIFIIEALCQDTCH